MARLGMASGSRTVVVSAPAYGLSISSPPRAELGRYRAEQGLVASGDRSSARLYPERWARGARHGAAKLTDEQVAEIRARYAVGEAPITRLAAEYGVGTSQIWRIVTGQSRQPAP